jgi:hypothetical protein
VLVLMPLFSFLLRNLDLYRVFPGLTATVMLLFLIYRLWDRSALLWRLEQSPDKMALAKQEREIAFAGIMLAIISISISAFAANLFDL